jgi:two-component system, response regulator RegA
MKPLPQALLLVDDDPRFRERMATALRERGVAVWLAADAKSALEVVATTDLDAVVTDLKMPGKGGLELVRTLAELKPELRMVVLTGYGTIATAVEAMRLGASDYLVKPCNADQLLAAFGDSVADEPEGAEVPTLARLEREHIERVLVECQGNVSKAARLLGIHRRTLQYKLAKFPQSR